MNYYEAKFAREAKSNPTHWLIVCRPRGDYTLIQIGGTHD
ncbi:hypothetical protein [Yersinia phage fEV-1]|nr:hypothetical protein [Yersinia phage fEV-1]